MVGPGHDVITVEMVGGGAGIQVPTQLFLPCALSLSPHLKQRPTYWEQSLIIAPALHPLVDNGSADIYCKYFT